VTRLGTRSAKNYALAYSSLLNTIAAVIYGCHPGTMASSGVVQDSDYDSENFTSPEKLPELNTRPSSSFFDEVAASPAEPVAFDTIGQSEIENTGREIVKSGGLLLIK
jgi:hypothetical protein